MLVLSREVEQFIMIGNNVRITVLKVQGNKVRLGIDAPSSIPIYRSEVVERMSEDVRQKLPTISVPLNSV